MLATCSSLTTIMECSDSSIKDAGAVAPTPGGGVRDAHHLWSWTSLKEVNDVTLYLSLVKCMRLLHRICGGDFIEVEGHK